MPQLQKAIPVAAAPFKKFLRVVICSLPNGRSLGAPACFSIVLSAHCQGGTDRAIMPARITAGCPET
jgi:hypothetical protein